MVAATATTIISMKYRQSLGDEMNPKRVYGSGIIVVRINDPNLRVHFVPKERSCLGEARRVNVLAGKEGGHVEYDLQRAQRSDTAA